MSDDQSARGPGPRPSLLTHGLSLALLLIVAVTGLALLAGSARAAAIGPVLTGEAARRPDVVFLVLAGLLAATTLGTALRWRALARSAGLSRRRTR